MIASSRLKRLSTAAMGAALLCGMVAGPAFADYTLRILHTNDLHSRVDQVSKYNNNCSSKDADAGKCFGGYARVAAKVREIRSQGGNTVLLDGGDQFQGSLFYTTYKGQLAASMMNLIGYEAMAYEWEFNKAAGFTEEDDELPEFFYKEALEPTGKTARHHTAEVNRHVQKLMEQQVAG